jgi:hypothetical protein
VFIRRNFIKQPSRTERRFFKLARYLRREREGERDVERERRLDLNLAKSITCYSREIATGAPVGGPSKVIIDLI